jgi:hypothetical protein
MGELKVLDRAAAGGDERAFSRHDVPQRDTQLRITKDEPLCSGL